METLQEFRSRTGAFNQSSLPVSGTIKTAEGLALKVTEQGKMRGFGGNTVVFVLPEEVKEQIRLIQKKLYENCGDILAEPLEGHTFHITLHDLVNGLPGEELNEKIMQTRQDALTCTLAVREENARIKMRSNYLFNMVDTSMVLGFEPVEEDDMRLLMEYYERFQSVVKLDHPLTPHVTVAYFRSGILAEKQILELQHVVDYVKTLEPIVVELTGDMLQYQEFENMNLYKSYGIKIR